MSDSTRLVLPVVRWLQVGAAAAGLGMAALAAPAVASADDNAASSSADSARPSAARSGASGVKHRPTVRSAASRSAGAPRAAAGTSATKVAPSSAVANILKSGPRASTTAAAPVASSEPSLGYLRTLTRLNIEDRRSGTGPTVAINPTLTVTGLFNQVLRKDPTQEELQQYLDRWTRGGVNAVVAGLYTSTAFRESEVTNYYLELLGRAPTTLELSRGTTQLKLGKPEPQFAAEIVGSPNFSAASAFGGPDKWQPGSVTVPNADTVVSQMYRTMLGTTPDPLTAPTYVQQLAAGRSQGRVAREFVNSDAFRQAKVQEVYAAMGQTATPEQIAAAVQGWQRSGGLAGIATVLLAASTNVSRIEAGLVQLPNMTAVAQLQSLLLAQYNEAADGFVRLFNTLRITDPATGLPTCLDTCNEPLMALIRTGGAFRGLADSSIVINTDFKADTSKLVPSQNEVDLNKSLGYPLTHGNQVDEYLAGGYISSQKIITANNGTTIVDGHHRWSGLFVVNPDTQLASYDLGYTPSAKEALQETQMGIAAKDGYLPQEFVAGENLFTIKEDVFKARVVQIIDFGVPSEGLTPEPVAVRAAFAKYGYDTDAKITEYLWQNVVRMQTNNQPIPGATGRGFMPQPKPYDEVFAWMEGGNLSYSFPIIAFIG